MDNRRRQRMNTKKGDHVHQNAANSSTGSQSKTEHFKKIDQTNGNVNRTNKSGNTLKGSKYLEFLLQQPMEQIMPKMSGEKQFFILLEERDMPSNNVVIIIELISKFCDCEFSSLRLHVLQKSLTNRFLNTIQFYISSIVLQTAADMKKNSYFWKDPNSFWINFAKICETALREMPQCYGEPLSKLLKITDHNLTQIESMQNILILDDIKQEFRNLIDTAENIVKKLTKNYRRGPNVYDNEGEPPDDFRKISVYPTNVELLTNEKPFLRKNIIKGPYRDVEHYLDVQFRLLREDFVGPLRQAINAYMSDTNTRIENVRIYKKVQFIHPVTVTEHYCALLKLNFGNKKISFIQENSRRFMLGSLVCFTNDNFKSLIFGKIVDRHEKYLKNCELIIGFDEDKQLEYNVDYMMLECSIFFEPYYQVLSVMKKMTEEDFPMKSYIIDVNTSVQMPSYINPNVKFRIRGEGLNMIKWSPYHASKEEFHYFDESQNAAFRAALTREFSIIQGPPGTGKTYVGLKIAQTLLNNSSSWYDKTPMLIICYTNHALDQFLEGLIDTTEMILRIGGQSKNENLEKYNLRNHYRKMSESAFESKTTVTNCLSEIKKITDTLDRIRKYDSIINFKEFRSVLPEYEMSWFACATDEDMLTWLVEPEEDYLIERTHEGVQDFKKYGKSDNPETSEDGREKSEFDDLLDSVQSKTDHLLLNLNELHQEIQQNYRILNHNQLGNRGNYKDIFAHKNLEMKTRYLSAIYHSSKRKLDLAKSSIPTNPNGLDAMNSQYISRDERWNLYFYWVSLYKDFLLQEHERVNAEFRIAYKIYNESKDLENVHVLREMKVIGMTTTAAARLHSSLQMIKSPIVIIEEAAEVLEAHIVTSLTKYCKQLILIGDHKQLKPNTSNYQIERFYYLGISLFERMILNNVQCFTLDVQHRMRPEISALIKPDIYPNLKDHKSVLNRPKIRGMEKCMFFIDHQIAEESGTYGTTKKNMHEVTFLIQLAKYLILNGYEPKEITILAAYLGQMFELKKEASKYPTLLKDIKIAVLDNYQGEECDIILLSLVRSNAYNKIGFLSIDNRVCVALSRARNGLYIMGNMAQLCGNSELWSKIRKTLAREDAIGPSLTLRCQNHERKTLVSTADDFLIIAEGGCIEICGKQLLTCPHTCQRLCHALDTEHKDTKCQEKCNRLLCDFDPPHMCQKQCYEDCGVCTQLVTRILNCKHEATMPCYEKIENYNCKIQVPVTLSCGHATNKPCYIKPEKHQCPFPCDTRLECGHSCLRNCHVEDDPQHFKYKCPKPCEKLRKGCKSQELEKHMCPKLCCDECLRCEKIIEKPRTKCPHHLDVPCYIDADQIQCTKPCNKELPCGHKCVKNCGVSCGRCIIKVERVIPGCNHIQELPCYKEPSRKFCSGGCSRIMTCGHACKRKCKESCDPSRCEEIVNVAILAICGHIISKIPCYLNALYETQGRAEGLISYCTVPCEALLNCGPEKKHVCSGTCGECFQGRMHKRCESKCGKLLLCNHECELLCRQTCKPCQKPCSFKCRHGVACKSRCGEPCTKCVKPCPRKCEHQQCKNICGDICHIPPCDMRCKKKLPNCGHRCVGFCGDPCPPLCGICDKEKLQEIVFGTENEEDARFVLLQDCGHVFESSGLELLLTQNEIKFKACPKCKTTICNTERYSSYFKRAILDIVKVKLKQRGTQEENAKKRKEINEKIHYLRRPTRSICDEYVNHNTDFMESFLKQLALLNRHLYYKNKSGRAHVANLVELDSIGNKYQLVQDVYEILKENSKNTTSWITNENIQLQVEFILTNILRHPDDITEAEIRDIQKETNRLKRLIQFHLVVNSPKGIKNKANPIINNEMKKVSILIYSLNTYEEEIDERVRRLLKELNTTLKSYTTIDDFQKRNIVKAVGMRQGHWRKCPNEHPYTVLDCDESMIIDECSECKVPIDDRYHELVPKNTKSSDVDEASANIGYIARFDLEDFL